MLYKFRAKHARKILWGLLFVIIPAFVLWGGFNLFKQREKPVGKIGKKQITLSQFEQYFNMAKLNYFLTSIASKNKEIDSEDITAQAWEYALLLWKADQDKISVSDQEVVLAVRNSFFPGGQFSQSMYNRFLQTVRLQPRAFEEYMRKFIRIQKVFQKYLQVDITETEIKNIYRKENEKVKIDYLLIPYDRFTNKIVVTSQDSEDFYKNNTALFKEPPKVKFRYIILPQDEKTKNEVLQAVSSVKSLETLKDVSIELKETKFIAMQEPIDEIGWQPSIVNAAFLLKKGELSPPLQMDNGQIIIEKIDEKTAFIPPFNDIQSIVEEKLKEQKVKEVVEQFARDILKEINEKNIKELSELKNRENLEFKQTDYFKYDDYIEGLGVDRNISNILFNLAVGEIYTTPVVLTKGVYILQFKERTVFDEKDFLNKKNEYIGFLRNEKSYIKKFKFLADLEKEANLEVFSKTTTSEE